ncbi:MAG: helix-turn-helix transcriptional regulator [Candidatus Beckwithbacteria bacterium]|nr:helix-turn-helix transcriptional regulator [Candidatus Beckwithbacteria bacterium]
MNDKIKTAIKRGDLISYDEVFSRYSKKHQREILKQARYLKAAMALRKLRKQLKLTQEKLASKMKVKREFISRAESGEQNLTLETLYQIAEATGKSFRFQFK